MGHVLFFCYNTYTTGEHRNLFGENSEKCAPHIVMKEYDQLILLSFCCSPFSIMLTDQSCPLLCPPKLLKRHYYLHLQVSQLPFNILYMWRPWLVVLLSGMCCARQGHAQNNTRSGAITTRNLRKIELVHVSLPLHKRPAHAPLYTVVGIIAPSATGPHDQHIEFVFKFYIYSTRACNFLQVQQFKQVFQVL